jgi:diguanylate cyclase (GGDEF)-like protein
MSIFNAFIYKAIKDKAYLWYTLYVFFYGINFLVLNNLFFPSSDTSESYWSEFFHVAPLMLYFLFIILFTINFLNINKNFPKLNVALKALILLILLSIISYFVASYTFAVMLSTYIATFIPFILIGIGIYSAVKKVPLARFYIIAWLPNCCLFLVFAATFHGALEYNNFTGFANDIGMMLEVVLLALALAYRVRIFQQQTYDAQELLLQEQTQHTYKLNQMVLDRTKELESKNQELENLSKTDPLTGLYNRRKLDSTVLTNIKFSERYNNSFGLILLDLDDFKRINDKFGHYIGDEVLKKTAKILTKYTRSTDIVGRWGGEEFLIICPNADEKSVYLITEKLCSAIYSESASDLAPFTASFGVAVYKQNETTEQLVTRADKALYMSKDKGKNQFSIAV